MVERLQAYAIKKPAFKFGIEDLGFVKDSREWRLTATPFVHDYENKVFLGHAAPWKGMKGAEFWEEAEKHVGEEKVGLGNALKKAISISQACRDVTGIVRVGDRFLPKKVICQMEKAGKPVPKVTA